MVVVVAVAVVVVGGGVVVVVAAAASMAVSADDAPPLKDGNSRPPVSDPRAELQTGCADAAKMAKVAVHAEGWGLVAVMMAFGLVAMVGGVCDFQAGCESHRWRGSCASFYIHLQIRRTA